jgi:hypothetical protein
LFFTARFLLALSFAQHTQIVFGVLHKVFGSDTVIAQMGVTRQLVIFINDLLRRATHFALGTRTVKHSVHNICTRRATAVRLGPRTGFRSSHLLKSALLLLSIYPVQMHIKAAR